MESKQAGNQRETKCRKARWSALKVVENRNCIKAIAALFTFIQLVNAKPHAPVNFSPSPVISAVSRNNCTNWKCTQRNFHVAFSLLQIASFVNYEWSHHLSKHVNLSDVLPFYQVHNGQIKSAERWKIAYQIEAIRLNCSHKYCFSHAYAMIARPRLCHRCSV